MLAGALGYNFYDREIMQLASIDSGISEALFAQADERTKGFSLFRAIRTMNGGEFVPSPPDQEDFISDENLFRYQARVIQTLCDTEDCVIVGRCADYILRERENVLKLFVHAPMEARIATVRELNGLMEQEAERAHPQDGQAARRVLPLLHRPGLAGRAQLRPVPQYGQDELDAVHEPREGQHADSL